VLGTISVAYYVRFRTILVATDCPGYSYVAVPFICRPVRPGRWLIPVYVYEGGIAYVIEAPIDTLPIFLRDGIQVIWWGYLLITGSVCYGSQLCC